MGWGRKRVQNTAVIDMPSPAGPGPARVQNVTYDNRANYTPLVLGMLLLLVLLPWGIWQAGVSIFTASGMDMYQAPRAMATTVKWSVGTLFVVFVIGLAARFFLNDLFAHRERMRQFDIDALTVRMEEARYRQLTYQAQQPAVNGRLSEEDNRWQQIVIAVMFTAYDTYANDGEFAGKARPWSRRSVQAIALRDGSNPTEAEASRVRDWLTNQGIVRKDQININRFPDLAAVQKLLNQLYHMPIQISAPAGALLRTNEGYEHI